MNIFFTALFLFFGVLAASSPPQALHFDMAVQRVLSESPTLEIRKREVQERAGVKRQVQLYPNPVFSYLLTIPGSIHGYRWKTMRQETYFLNQLLEINGQKRKKVQAASAQYKAAWMGIEISKLTLIHHLHEAFIRAVAAQQLLELAKERQQSASDFPSVEEKQEEKPSYLKQQKEEIENALAQLDIEKAQIEWQGAQHALALLWGSTCPDFQTVVYPFFDIAPPPPFESCLDDLANQPEIEQLDYEYEAATHILSSEKKANFPDPTLALGYQYEYMDEGLLIGISFPLPFWNRNQGNIQAAYAHQRKIEKQKEQLWLLLKEKFTNAYFELACAYREAETLKKLIQSFSQTLQKISKQDQSEAREALFELKEKWIEALVNYHNKWANIHYLNSQDES